MNDNIIQKILDCTDGGLNIILSLYPEAQQCIDNKRHFKLRDSEKTASATLRKNTTNGNYYVKDFGGEFSGNAVNLYMFKENVELKEAIKILGNQYGVFANAAPPEVLLPIREKRKATELELEGSYLFDYKDDLNDFEVETIFAKHVMDYAFHIRGNDWKKYLNQICAAYGLYALTSFTYIKDGVAKITKSTDKYPIFVIKGEGFEKIYQPKALDKKYRFRYSGTKPANYIFGYKRFCKTYEDQNAKWLSENETKKEAGEPVAKTFKLPEVIECSGDRDSINVAALGYNVIWLNSEEEVISWSTWTSLTSKAWNVYLLPDLDSTGLRQGHKKALKFMEMKTIKLPMELMEKKDWRGNPCKDVRDYLSYYKAKDFDKLVENALEYKFWDEEPNEKNKNKTVYTFNNVRAYNFIQANGFHRIVSKTSKDGEEYVHIVNNVVKVVKGKAVKAFINQFLEDRYTADQKLRNTFLRSPQLKDDSLDNLKFIEPDFNYFDKDYQYFFFKNKTWQVTADEIIEHLPSDVSKMVWDHKVIDKNAKKLPPAFTIIEVTNANDLKELDIEIHNQDCLFFNYLINTCRIYWRVELEERCEREYTTEEERADYRLKNKFNIAGPLLTKEEQQEQKKHLINKLYVLGYTLCGNKEKSKAWAPFLMDYKLSAEGESHGGSGKTIFATSLAHFLTLLPLDGKDKSLLDDKFAFENVTEQTELVLIDDLSRYVGIEPFFAKITGDLTVNPKYNSRFVIPYKRSPKIMFTSNYGVRDISSSAERRLIYAAFCDYYHNNMTGDYREERTAKHDFGKDLFDDFTEAEWGYFINTMVRCFQSYLKIPYKVNPPGDNVSRRNLQGIMGDAFLGWADVYFSSQSGRLDQMVPRNEAFADFIKQCNTKAFSPQRFSSCVEAWCKYYKYEFNPAVLRPSGRIIRKAPKKRNDGSFEKTFKKMKDGSTKEVVLMVATEMIYIKTTEFELDAASFKDEDDHEPEVPGGIVQSNLLDSELP